MFITVHLLLIPPMIAYWRSKVDERESLPVLHALQWSATMVIGIVSLLNRQMPPAIVLGYAALVTALMPLIGKLMKEQFFLILAAMHCGIALVIGAIACVAAMCTVQMSSGVRQVVFACLSFIAAVMISILKSGAGRRIRISWILWRRRSRIVHNQTA